MLLKPALFVLCFFAACVSSAKILGVFPFPSKSHHILSSALMKELAVRGHQVTMLSPFPLKNPPKTYTDVDLSEIIVHKDELMKSFVDNEMPFWQRTINSFKFLNLFSTAFMDYKGFKDFMKKGEQFDVVIQMVALNEASLGISHMVNATSVIDFSLSSSFPFQKYIHRNPGPYSYVPCMVTSLSDEMTFLQRVLNTVAGFGTEYVAPLISFQYQKRMLNHYFPQAPPLSELVKKVDLHLVNTHISTETPRPYLPNMIQIGGFVFNSKQNLTGDVKSFLDNSKEGVIYFSFGSNYNSTLMPKETLQAFIATFKELKYDVIWKYEEELVGKPANVLTKRWLPQTAILAHPNVKVFITHAGMGGTSEAIYNGVPMIAIPLFADQHKNSAAIVKNGFGVELKIEEFSKEKLLKAVDEVTKNKSFLEKIKLRSDLYKNQEMNPMDKAVFWVEHVIKHKGAKHLKAKAAQLYWYEYMLLDVMSFIAVAAALFLYITYVLMKFTKKIFCCVFCRNKKVDAVKKKQ